jgi:2-hydroxy-3-oxopropionate reductase
MLTESTVTTAILQDGGVIEAAPDNALIIDMGSVEPECDQRLAALAAAHGKRYLDAPVSGGVAGAEAATLTIFVGGREEDMARAMPLFEALGRPNLIGPLGAGQTAKLANQLIVAITIGAVAEAFKLAESAGCDAAVLRDALRGGFADSRILDLHGGRMVRRDFIPGGRAWSQLKDIRNALALAGGNGLDLPLANTVEAGFRSLVEDYDGGDLDHAAYYLWLEKRMA